MGILCILFILHPVYVMLMLKQTPKNANILSCPRSRRGAILTPRHDSLAPSPMANHQQHTNFSTASGIIFGTLAWYPCGFPAVTCLLAGGLCGMGGMLPDIDIKTSRSYHDCMSITACIAAMLVILKVSTTDGVTGEMLAIIGTMVFLAIKFGVGRLIQSFTAHRGLIHSVPFCILCGEIIFLITDGDTAARILKAAGLSLGFFSHLLLDEIYSVEVVQGKLNTKKSSGTAIKFGMKKHLHLTIVLYIVLGFATYIAFKQPSLVGGAFDRTLDNIAAMTIRGTQHFGEMSRTAQQSLRNLKPGNNQTDTTTDETTPEVERKDDSLRRYPMPDIEIEPVIAKSPEVPPTTISLPNTVQPPADKPMNPAIAHGPLTRPPLVSEMEPPRPNGRPPLLSEMEQMRSGSPNSTSQLPPAKPLW